MRGEEWRPVPGHRGYEASSEARVRSVPRKLRDGRAAGGVVLVPTLDKDGYGRVKLGRKLVGVHVAVALAFLGRPEVRHLDGDESNNRPGNLAWGSRRDNEQDKWKNGRDRKEEKEDWDGSGSRQFLFGTEAKTTATRLIGLSEAVALGIVSGSVAAVRGCRKLGTYEFPAPAGYAGVALLYDPDALASWEKRRRGLR